MKLLYYRLKLWLFAGYYLAEAEKQMWRDAYELSCKDNSASEWEQYLEDYD